MIPLRERLKQRNPIIADGAIGSLLIQKGLKEGSPPEIINLEKPVLLEEIALSYLNAGAEIIQTNTFGASPLKLEAFGLADKTEEINLNAVRAVKKTVGGRAYIYASCGPCGRLLEPYGDVSEDEVFNSYLRQMKILLDEGVDNICIETMTDLNEAVTAIRAAKALTKTTPVFATMTFDATPRGFFTIMGVSIEQAARGLTEAGADAIGTNCGNGIDNSTKIAREMRNLTPLPIIVQSNAGIPILKENKIIYTETPVYMAQRIPELLQIGVNIIGGCCGTTPEHIAVFHQTVREHCSFN